jgi:aminopeptidase YwaD
MRFEKAIPFLCIYLLCSTYTLAQDIEQVKKDIEVLTSSNFAGRGYSNEGDQKAARYILDRFNEVGLQPVLGQSLQKFPVTVNTFPNRANLKIDKKQLEPGVDFILNASSKSGKGKSKLLYLDSLIFSQVPVQDAFLARDLKKTTVVYPAKWYSALIQRQDIFDHLYEAKSLIGLQEKKLTASISSSQLCPPNFEIKIEEFPSDAKTATMKVDAILKKEYTTQNVLGMIEGTVHPDQFIFFTAHYDHLGQLGKTAYFPGANDNAAGIAILLDLANYFKNNPPAFSIVFIAFGAEELGLLGSEYYVKHPVVPLKQIEFLINLDLVGTGDEGITVVNGSVFQEEFKELVQINESKKYLPDIKKRGTAANSDHYYFTENGVKAFFIYTLGGIKAYHDVFDRPETLPLTKYSELYQMIIDFTILRW